MRSSKGVECNSRINLESIQKWKHLSLYPANIRLDKTSWRRVSPSSSDDVFKTNIFVFVVTLQNVFKMFSRRLQDVLPRHLQDVFKTSCKSVFKTSLTSSRPFEEVFTTPSPANISCFPSRLEDVFSVTTFHLLRRLQDVLKTSSRHICKTPSTRLDEVLWDSKNATLKTSSRRFQDVSSS